MSVTLVHSGARLWSISTLAEEFGVDRRTVKRREGGVELHGKAEIFDF